METNTGNSDFRAGRVHRLDIPTCVVREWAINGVSADREREFRAEHEEDVGYRFDWGQVVEIAFSSEDPGYRSDPRALALSWNFVLTAIHDGFLDAGMQLDELSDIAVALLLGWEYPEFIQIEDGDADSAFEVLVFGYRNVPAARQWVGEFFLGQILPDLIAKLRFLHTQSTQTRNVVH
jgi:hypothetical protein